MVHTMWSNESAKWYKVSLYLKQKKHLEMRKAGQKGGFEGLKVIII